MTIIFINSANLLKLQLIKFKKILLNGCKKNSKITFVKKNKNCINKNKNEPRKYKNKNEKSHFRSIKAHKWP